MELSVIFPVHNEEGNLEELVARLHAALVPFFGVGEPATQNAFELLFVDDASTDRSGAMLDDLARRFADVRVIHHAQSRGQTGAFKSGFDAARGDVVITMDADLEVFPEDIPLFMQKMRQGYDLVNGIRTDRKHETLIRLQSRAYNILMRLVFRSPLTDNASNYTAFRAALVQHLPLTANDHRYLFPILRTRGMRRYAEVAVRHTLRTKGASKYGRFKAVRNALEMGPVLLRLWSGFYVRKTTV